MAETEHRRTHILTKVIPISSGEVRFELDTYAVSKGAFLYSCRSESLEGLAQTCYREHPFSSHDHFHTFMRKGTHSIIRKGESAQERKVRGPVSSEEMVQFLGHYASLDRNFV